ncbi:Crp/Fnr family transcriptional regulator [Methylobacterium durans]|uniref:Crp/Fnr family transcriptional regulator n=1 Tax=Methylobacterium durans TaxID=2202825 RepID=UPI002AFFAEEC|nr:Crp/Fnr family transcriptional regulator [Methylobacterium durans]MEA1830922.1 Crp/Fnr family transcriptional regulator [Methylobacterium durans]
MSNPFIRKLEHAGPLSEDERQALSALTQDARTLAARHDIVPDQDAERIYLLMSGVACRYKTLVDGTRRIVSFVLPGDLCRIPPTNRHGLEWRIGILTRCSVVEVSRATLHDLVNRHPGLNRALWWLALAELNRSREWLVNDSRPGMQRLAHLLCEVLACLQAVGLADENSCELALSQVDLADALGISHVHINRILQALRKQDLIVWQRHRLVIPDVPRIHDFADFDPTYLDLDGLSTCPDPVPAGD